MHRLVDNGSSTGQQTLIGLLRHGRTEWNEENRIQGRHDSPLSPSGREEVHGWADFLAGYEIDQIVASDLGRVRETVAIIGQQCKDIPVLWDPELREQSWGRWEGKTFAELKREEAEELEAQIRAGWDFRPPGGESRKEVLERGLTAIRRVMARFPGKRILIVSHEGIVKSLIYHLSGRAFLPEEKKLLQKRQLHLL
ncbi:MAG: histidine phosphatase family protein, partial [Thermodesulfobacteriota bacterium]